MQALLRVDSRTASSAQLNFGELNFVVELLRVPSDNYLNGDDDVDDCSRGAADDDETRFQHRTGLVS